MTDAVHMAHSRTAEQKAVMRKIQEDGADPFDWELLSKYHDRPVLRKSHYWLITENDYPYDGSELHLLLIYRERVRLFSEVDKEGFADLHSMLVWIATTYKLTHGSLLMRFGDVQYTGGSVDHLHVHVIVGGTNTENEKLKVTAGYKK